MGNSNQVTMPKHVVIVGYSYAGFTMAEQLWDHFRITIIDQKDYFEHLVLNIKTMIDPKWGKFLLFPYENITVPYKDKLKFVQGTLTCVNKDDTIDIQKKTGEIEKISYDYLVLCTGFTYNAPVKDDEATTLEAREASYQSYYKKVQDAKSILVVGSGVVGVQLVGEFADEFATKGLKRVALCTRGSKLLNTLPPKAGKLADKFLREHNVTVMYNTHYDEKDKEKFDYDLVLKCVGYRFKTDFLKSYFPDCIAPNGQIYVNDLMQISAVDPLVDPVAESPKPNIYCLGDNCQTSLDEEKSVVSMEFLVHYVRKNIMKAAKGKQPDCMIPEHMPFSRVITIGPHYGILCINGLVKEGEEALRAKAEIHSIQARICRGSEVSIRPHHRGKTFERMVCCINTWCCRCCPCECSEAHAPPKRSLAKTLP